MLLLFTRHRTFILSLIEVTAFVSLHIVAHAGTCERRLREQKAIFGPGSVELTGDNVGSGSALTTPGVRKNGLPTPTLQAQGESHVA